MIGRKKGTVAYVHACVTCVYLHVITRENENATERSRRIDKARHERKRDSLVATAGSRPTSCIKHCISVSNGPCRNDRENDTAEEVTSRPSALTGA